MINPAGIPRQFHMYSKWTLTEGQAKKGSFTGRKNTTKETQLFQIDEMYCEVTNSCIGLILLHEKKCNKFSSQKH